MFFQITELKSPLHLDTVIVTPTSIFLLCLIQIDIAASERTNVFLVVCSRVVSQRSGQVQIITG